MSTETKEELLQRIERMENAHGRLFNNFNREIEDLNKKVDRINEYQEALATLIKTIPNIDELTDIKDLLSVTRSQMIQNTWSISSIQEQLDKLQFEQLKVDITKKNTTKNTVQLQLGNTYTKKISSGNCFKTWEAIDGSELFEYYINLQGLDEKFVATFNKKVQIKPNMKITFVLGNNKLNTPKYRLRRPKLS